MKDNVQRAREWNRIIVANLRNGRNADGARFMRQAYMNAARSAC